MKKNYRVLATTPECAVMAELRAVRVTFNNGDSLTTSMAARLTDAEIRAYYKKGRVFNLGVGREDCLTRVESVEILK